MNKSILFLANLLIMVSCYSSQRSLPLQLPISASTGDLERIQGAVSSFNSRATSPILAESCVKTGGNSPDIDQSSHFVQAQVERKFCEHYDIDESVVLAKEKEIICQLAKVLDLHGETLFSSKDFEDINYANLLVVVDNLQKYDFRKKFWLGSIIVDRQNQDILEAESLRIEELKRSNRYSSVVHGLGSRLEQRQQYLKDREQFLVQLLARCHYVSPILQEIRRI